MSLDLTEREDVSGADVAVKNRRAPFSTLLTAVCLLVVGALIFRDFLFGGGVLLYKDSGSDSVNDYYPWFVHLSDYVRSHGIPSWSFSVGMGQDISFFAGYLILDPVTWLPKGEIASALIFQHLAKVVIAGLLFFRFLQLRGLKLAAAVLGSLLVSFSAYMCMGACWYPLADQVVCFTALLLAVEEALINGRWFLLPLAVGLVGFIDSFHLYLAALLLLFYVPARLFGRYGWQPRFILRGSVILAGVAFLGAGLGAIITVPNLYALLNSPRGSGTTSALGALSSLPIFVFEARLHYITAALRPFANDILGTAENFRGWQNYLEAPLTYCGLLCLVILPQAFVRTSGRHKLLYGMFLAGILVLTVFPWFRYLFWVFQGDYYRTLSLFSILGVVTLGMVALSRYLEGLRLNLWLLAGTVIVVVGLLYLPLAELQSRIDSKLRQEATILLLLYPVLLAAGQILRRQQLAGWLIVAVAAGELILFDQITVSNRSAVTKEELRARVGYNDETVDVMRDIKADDKSGFFRITKFRGSGPGIVPSLNDAMVFGYYGTSCYSSFNNVNYTNFLTAVNAIPADSEMHTRWSVGLLNDSVLSLFAGEKYALVDDPALFRATPQYELVRAYGRDYLFRNQFFLPFGLTFDHYLAEEVFRQLPPAKKSETLLGVAVLPTASGQERGILPMTLSELERTMSVISLSDLVALRRKTGLHLTFFRQSRLEGTVRLEKKSILVLQTPFDRGWHALQDGQPASVLKVNIGLLGVELDAGEHQVELHYRNPLLVPAFVITLASFLILAASLWRWPRLRVPA